MAIIVWNGTGFASIGSNWIGGVIPGVNDTARFGAAGGACTWDIAQVLEVDVTTLFLTTVFQIVDLHVTGAGGFVLVTNATQDWNTNGNDLNVDGRYDIVGTGAGVTHTAGGTLRLGGASIDIDAGIMISPVVIHHSLATPTAAKDHNVQVTSGSSFDNVTIADNQSFIGATAFWADNAAWGTNINVSGIGLFVSNSSGTAWTGVENITWNGDSINSITLRWNQLTQLPVSDYGNIQVEYRSDTDFGAGTYQTTGLLDIWFNFGTSNLDMPSGCTFLLGALEIGNASNPALGCILVQQPGSSLQVTNDLTIVQDDTVATNQLSRKAGVLNTVIGGNFIVEADASIDFTDDSSTISIGGNIDINSLATAAFGSTSIIQTGSGNVSNPTIANAFNKIKYAAAGFITIVTGAIAHTGLVSFGGGAFINVTNIVTVLMNGGNQFVGASITNFTTVGSTWHFTGIDNTLTTIEAADYGGATTLQFESSTISLEGDTIFDQYFLGVNTGTAVLFVNGHVLTTAGIFVGSNDCAAELHLGDDATVTSGSNNVSLNATVGVTVTGTGTFLLGFQFRVQGVVALGPGINVVDAFNVDIELNATFTTDGVNIECTNDYTVAGTHNATDTNVICGDSHIVPITGAHNMISGSFTCKGDCVPLGAIDFGSVNYFHSGSAFDLTSATAAISDGDESISFSGSAIQTVNFGTFQPNGFTDAKNGGDIILSSAVTFSAGGELATSSNGDHFITWLAGSINELNGPIKSTYNDAGATSHRTSIAATQATLNVGSNGIVYSSEFKDIIASTNIKADSLSCVDNGNNVNIDFGSSFPQTPNGVTPSVVPTLIDGSVIPTL